MLIFYHPENARRIGLVDGTGFEDPLSGLHMGTHLDGLASSSMKRACGDVR